MLLLRQMGFGSIVAAQSLSRLFMPILGYFFSFSKKPTSERSTPAPTDGEGLGLRLMPLGQPPWSPWKNAHHSIKLALSCKNDARWNALIQDTKMMSTCYGAVGSKTINLLPLPTVLWTRIEPPMAVTRSWTMVRPRPKPPVARVREMSVR